VSYDPRLSNRSLTSAKVPVLSLDMTRNLINECVDSYLQTRLDQSRRLSTGNLNGRDQKESSPIRSLPSQTRSDIINVEVKTVAYSIPSPSRAPPAPPPHPPPVDVKRNASSPIQQSIQDSSRSIFRPLENYLIACFTRVECLNRAFLAHKSPQFHRAASDSNAIEACKHSRFDQAAENSCPEMDAKTLLLGDFAENGMWWTGRGQFDQHRSQSDAAQTRDGGLEERAAAKSSRINSTEVHEWYRVILSTGRAWRNRLQELQREQVTYGRRPVSNTFSAEEIQEIELDVFEARAHVQRTLLKASENILRRPGRPLRTPEDSRFLLVLIANPLLYTPDSSLLTYPPSVQSTRSTSQTEIPAFGPAFTGVPQDSMAHRRSPSSKSSIIGKHSGIIKRVLGLMAGLPSECHHFFVNSFSRFSEAHFRRLVELVGSFVTYRLSRQHGRRRSNSHDPHGGLIPSISGPGAGTSAQLHAALGVAGTSKSPEKNNTAVGYTEDWQIRAAARVMSLLFSANTQGPSRSQYACKAVSPAAGRGRAGSASRNQAQPHRQVLPTSAFYNTLLDYSDLVADFEAWESRRGKFSFCQYPMFLSIWAKIRIMEHDARRQMEIKAREAFFNSIMGRKAIDQYLVLKVRRDCLVEDSLRSVSEIVGIGQEEIKKGLRIEFLGEEGLDSGGLRKEWFLLLVREVFDSEHGLFDYDEESRYCYFNPNSFETSDQFFLVGVVLGLAIYNSTILDVALPPFAFRKLLASAPAYTGPATSSVRPTYSHTLADLAEFRPGLADGLKKLLDFDGNVEETYCRDFVAAVERYDQLVQIPLCPNGENRVVTNSNRHEFVNLYVKYLLDTSVTRQYEPFKRGFFSVCEGNALSLFRPDEIELLVRGSDEPLDVATLRSVAIYDGWGKDMTPAEEPVVTWFWDFFLRAGVKDQRKMLGFITSSDRIPAMGATSLVIKISCLGDHSSRFPIARTCFNMLGLYRYETKEILEDMLWRAVVESEGFGIK